MKKLFSFFMLLVFACSATSCVTMKKDCQGVRHTRLKNGIYL